MRKLFIAAITALATATPAMANPYRAISASSLTKAVEATGTRIVYDPARCYEKRIYGYYQLAWDSAGNITKDVMGICVENHGSDYAELNDTLRHESIHVAQACNEGATMLGWNVLAQYAAPRIMSMVQRYPVEDQHLELEAFVSAKMLSNDQVAGIVRKVCNQ